MRKAQQWWTHGQLTAAAGTLDGSKEWAHSANRFFNTLSLPLHPLPLSLTTAITSFLHIYYKPLLLSGRNAARLALGYGGFPT